MDKQKTARIKLISSMFIFGSIGLFVRSIPLPSPVIANARAIIGAAFILLVILIGRKGFDRAAIKRNALPLLLSGLMLGFNWVLLFESYRFTSVAIGTLCYYMAPLMVVLLSPALFGERLSPRKLLCIGAALLGMVFVSGVAEGSLPQGSQAKGIIFGLSAAALYAAIICCNKKIKGVNGIDRTLVQLAISAVILIPYNLLTVELDFSGLGSLGLIMLLTVGIVHTGFCYYLYFGSMEDLPGQSVAILSYIDPAVAVLLSALILKESMSALMWIGAVLIIGAAILLELPEKQ